jgi:hypothetical protein
MHLFARRRQTADSPSELTSQLIGRDDDLAYLVATAAAVRQGTTPDGRIVVLTGPAGVGKRALMREFKRMHGRDVRVGPVIDLREPPPFERMLKQIADELDPDAFGRLYSGLDAARKREAGRKTLTEQAGQFARQGPAAASDAFPGLITSAGKLVGEIAALGADAREAARDLDLVKPFEDGLASIAARSELGPVLLFANVDAFPGDPTVAWLRETLLPDLIRRRVVVVVSAASEQAVAQFHAVEGAEVRLLERLNEDESLEFIRRLIGIEPDSRLAREIAADANGFPKRLAGYRTYFERRGKPEDTDGLPDGAQTWVGGDLAFEPLQSITDRAARRVFLCASALRVINAELLRRVAEAAHLDADLEPEELLDLERRPPWIVPSDAGWTFDAEPRVSTSADASTRLSTSVYISARPPITESASPATRQPPTPRHTRTTGRASSSRSPPPTSASATQTTWGRSRSGSITCSP